MILSLPVRVLEREGLMARAKAGWGRDRRGDMAVGLHPEPLLGRLIPCLSLLPTEHQHPPFVVFPVTADFVLLVPLVAPVPTRLGTDHWTWGVPVHTCT